MTSKVMGLTGVTAIATKDYHTVSLKSDGSVWCWGLNDSGQLGNYTITNSSIPVQVTGLTEVRAVEAGGYHTVALKSNGTVWAWGLNDSWQLGNDTTVNSSLPLQVAGFAGVNAVAAGEYHTMAMKSNGTIWAWGYNFFGQLGYGSTMGTSTPIQATLSTDAMPPYTTASPVGGTYSVAQSISLSANEPATIYFTVDGAAPTYPISGTTQVYGGPISVASTTTLKYFGRDTAGNIEAVKTQTYTIIPIVYGLTVSLSGNGSGCVTLSTGGGCVGSFGGSFDSGTVVTIIATANAGSVFSSWSGCDSTSGNQCTVTVTAVKNVTATFLADTTPPLTTPSPMMGTYRDAQNVALTCTDGTGSGCATTYYCLESGCTPTTVYSGPIAFAASTILRFYSSDLAGNNEAIKSYAYTIDPALAYRFERLWPQLPQSWYFNGPQSIAVDASGNIYVVDNGNNRIQKFDSSGNFLTQWGSVGSGNGQFQSPWSVIVDASGNIYVADNGNNRIQKFDSNGSYVTQWGSYGSGNGQFQYPLAVAVDVGGNVYVTDNTNRIQKFTSVGTYVTQWGTAGSGNGQFNGLYGIAVDASGYVYVADSSNNRIQKFDSSGSYLTQWGTSGSGNGQFASPYGVAVDASGNVYVSDTNNSRIQKFAGNGIYLTQWGSSGRGNGQFQSPFGAAVDASGNVYVADFNNNRVQKFNLAVSVPDVPTGVTATAGIGQATVSFTPPVSNGGSAILFYTVTSSPGNITAYGSASPITVPGLANGTPYTFTVTASNAAGAGPTSTASNSVTPAASYPLFITFAGTGGGTVGISTGGTCSGTCSQPIDNGAVVVLTPAPNGSSVFSGWSGCDSTSGNQCTVTMSSARSVAAYFNTTVLSGVKIGGSYYATIGSAYGSVSTGSEISLKGTDFYEVLNFNRPVAFNLRGGYSWDFSSMTGLSTIHGSITVTDGTVTFDNIVIQ